MAFGERLKEANNINKSLTVLGQVINSLVENSQGKSRHIPYRDSKLTFLLKDSLGGNSKTIMIAAISSASNAFCETLSTLKFAQRAKMIKNKALVNEESSGNVEMLKKEMKRLKDELLSATNCINDLKQNNIDIRDSFFMETAKLTPNYEIMFEKTNRLMINSRCKILSASKYIFEKEKLLEIEASFKENFKELNQNFDIIQENSINFEKEYKNLKETLLLCTKNEINYRMVIKLCHMRLERNNSFLNYCSNDSFLQEISNLKDENNRLHEILTNSMNINFVKDKNIRKKGKHKLRHHLNEIKQLFNNLERQVKKKKEFESLIQNSSYDESILVELKKKIDILNEENTKFF